MLSILQPIFFRRCLRWHRDVVEKPLENMGSSGPMFEDEEAPQFGQRFSKLAHVRTCRKVWLRSVQWSATTAFEKARTAVKYTGLPGIRIDDRDSAANRSLLICSHQLGVCNLSGQQRYESRQKYKSDLASSMVRVRVIESPLQGGLAQRT